MPTKLPADEEKLLRFFIKEGATEEKIPVVANRFRMKLGDVKRKLALKRVQEELRIRMEPVRLEQQRQQMLADSVAEATAKLIADKEKAEAELKAATTMPSMELTVDLLERELARLVCLDGEKHGRIKLSAIQTGYVIKGVMEQGNARRVNPVDKPLDDKPAGVYTNVFDRLRLERESTPETVPENVIEASLVDGVYDLTPTPTVQLPAKNISLIPPSTEAFRTKEKPAEMPPEGESLDTPVPVLSNTRVITVDIG